MREFYAIAFCLTVSLLAQGENGPKDHAVDGPLSMLVMDPLADWPSHRKTILPLPLPFVLSK